MKKYKLLISIIMVLNFSACSNDTEITKETHSLKTNHTAYQTLYAGISSMKECGRGYVVGVWSNANSWNEWAVWLSKTGRSWNNNDAKIYWSYSKLRTDYDSGKNAYATILAAQASGQMVALLDDQWPARCNTWGSGLYEGPQFNSVQAWFP
ncbi:hypothetical protein ID850_00815 [Xenorhabdus sp. Flor]|uniref:hypothetical protein n=1 Tax=Xenorhabdus cabanillasii TaxID=351673 RepID=UPI0019866C1A|nr:hypothetical protein [Xenorhabdus sp. Flor]MBD2813327.1 hypothetical protein [Xenorhabdus sp. Flor]